MSSPPRSSKRPGQASLVWLAVLLGLFPSQAAGGDGRLSQRIKAMVSKYEAASGAVCGLSVVDLRDEKTLLEVRPDRLFIPASNQKLLTSAFALARLGEKFKFTTSVYLLGRDILIVGGGDPTLGDPVVAGDKGETVYAELDRWAQAIRRKVGPAFGGDLLVCGSFPLKSFRHPDWPESQRHTWYSAPVAGLNFHNNCFDVTFTVADGRIHPNVSPASRFIRIANDLKKGKRYLWSLRSNDDDSLVRLRGKVGGASASPQRAAASNPPMLAGRVLADRLERAGLRFEGEIRPVKLSEVDLAAATLLARTETPLAVALKRANKRSLNMAAECIFLTAGDGTWAGSAKAMAACLVEDYGLSPADLRIRDGGGLSRTNRVTPRAVCKLLAALAVRPGAMSLLTALPRSGTDGSLARRLTRPPYKGRVLAKTGYVNGASCLSGYVLDRDHRVTVAFSILVGQVKLGKAWVAKDLQDAICRSLVDWIDK